MRTRYALAKEACAGEGVQNFVASLNVRQGRVGFRGGALVEAPRPSRHDAHHSEELCARRHGDWGATRTLAQHPALLGWFCAMGTTLVQLTPLRVYVVLIVVICMCSELFLITGTQNVPKGATKNIAKFLSSF